MDSFDAAAAGELESNETPLEPDEAQRIHRRLLVVAAGLGCITTTTVVAGWGIRIGVDDARRTHTILATPEAEPIAFDRESPLLDEASASKALDGYGPEYAIPTRSEILIQSELAISALQRAARRRAVLAAAGFDTD
ncbi:MAG: hypothetical protein ACF8PN_10975 [Phycisphaerales bacterium]